MKFGKKIIALLLMTVFVIAGLTGCAQKTQDGTNTKPTERTVVDMAGRTVTLPAEINSIATFGAIGVLNTFVETMGEGSKICNQMSPRFTKNDKWKYQNVFAPQLTSKPQFEDASNSILMENVLQAKPDLCLTMTKENTDLLAAQGLNVLYLSWNETEDVKKCITLLGEALNKPDLAKDYLEYFDKSVAKAQDLTKNIQEADKKSVVYGNVVAGQQPHIIAEWWIAAAGGISKTDNGRTTETLTYTTEDLLKWNPDVIILSDLALKKDVLADSRLSNISAIKNNKLYSTPTVAHVWGNRTTEQPLTIFWAMNKIYPEIMTTEALAAEIKSFYSHFFKCDLSDAQVKEIIGA